MKLKVKKKFLISLALIVQIISISVIFISIISLFFNAKSNNFDIVIPVEEDGNIQLQPIIDLNIEFVANNIDYKINILKSGVLSTERNDYIAIKRVNIDGQLSYLPKNMEKDALKVGFWVYPDFSKPSENGTSVIFGHRRAKLPPATDTFYNLDKVVTNDIIEVGKDHKIYYYEVVTIKIIDKTDWNSLKEEKFNSIKLVTCTPLGSSEKRLLVTAKLL